MDAIFIVLCVWLGHESLPLFCVSVIASEWNVSCVQHRCWQDFVDFSIDINGYIIFKSNIPANPLTIAVFHLFLFLSLLFLSFGRWKVDQNGLHEMKAKRQRSKRHTLRFILTWFYDVIDTRFGYINWFSNELRWKWFFNSYFVCSVHFNFGEYDFDSKWYIKSL